ncbi:valine--tRNA ligase [soil metagenome]
MSSSIEKHHSSLGKAYEPQAVEEKWYQYWQSKQYFKPSEDGGKEPFVIVMPPPNVTGELHMGHALFTTVEDILIRYKRMQGHPALWLPGADHAGIAGQWVVEKELAREGLTRHDLGREQFVARVWDWMERYQGRIQDQLRALGASCDWSRYRFTMDPGPARAVRVAFKQLYDEGLIYRGERLISWCPRCMTALSDLEVIHKDIDSSLWRLRYPLADGSGSMEVATTRPETMLGDTAVAVHPDDERYSGMIGKEIELPIMGRRIPVIADDSVDPAFGSGAVKVTPAHDPNDFELGRRHGLTFITVMNQDGTMNGEAGPFAGQTLSDARRNVVERLDADGALVSVEPYRHSVGTCERCETVVEPLISRQWFVSMKPLAEPALEVVRSGTVTFVPERFTGVYLHWMENIHDWCISRQLWWGHRIPVWYCHSCEKQWSSEEETQTTCPECRSNDIFQDEDVLDTWFSSGLWPFSTLGWPEKTGDLERYYPGSVLETGAEIIFFWVARMIFFGLKFMGEAPYHTVYIHGTVRDSKGDRMSKTKGNVLDPLTITSQYGTDALRFALITASGPGTDLKMSIDRVESNRNFANKLFNATRFVLNAIDGANIAVDSSGAPLQPDADKMALADKWIVTRLEATTSDVTRMIDQYQLHEAGRQLYEFLWSEFCDWYIEAAKVRLREGEIDPAAQQTLAYVLERGLRLLHPFMPFVTEELWQQLPHAGDALIVADWPGELNAYADDAARFDAVKEAIRLVRNVRAEQQVEPAKRIPAVIYPGGLQTAFEDSIQEFHWLARTDPDAVEIRAGAPVAPDGSVSIVTGGASIFLPLAGLIDFEAERGRLEKEIGEAEAEIERASAMLSNESFVSRAPDNVVDVQRKRLSAGEERLALLESRLSELG